MLKSLIIACERLEYIPFSLQATKLCTDGKRIIKHTLGTVTPKNGTKLEDNIGLYCSRHSAQFTKHCISEIMKSVCLAKEIIGTVVDAKARSSTNYINIYVENISGKVVYGSGSQTF